jgi:hypothetical protein
MKSLPNIRGTHPLTFALLLVVAAALTGCGIERGGESVVGSGGEGTLSGTALAKAATSAEKARAGVSVLVWNYADGRVAAGAEVAFSRSVSGRQTNFEWTATTDADGIAQVDLVDPPETPHGSKGMSGYYLARATDPTTGEVLGEWGSIPLNGGKEHVISLPIGGPITIDSGSGPLAYTGIGLMAWTGPIAGLPGTLVTAQPVVWQRNIDGEVWGLGVGYQDLKDVNPATREEVPGLVLTLTLVTKVLCLDLTGEGNSNQFRWEVDKAPLIPALVGVQSVGRILDPGAGEQARVAYVGMASVDIAEFGDLECGDDFSPPIQAAVDAGTALEYDFGGTFRIIRH